MTIERMIAAPTWQRCQLCFRRIVDERRRVGSLQQIKRFRITASARSFASSSTPNNKSYKDDDDVLHAIDLVKRHDPAGFLPGKLLPTSTMQTAYFAVRSFWVETGLRFGSTARVPPNATPSDHLEWWQQSIDSIYSDIDEDEDERQVSSRHPTLRLLRRVIHPNSDATTENSKHPKQPTLVLLSKEHFDSVLQGRRNDLDLKQYPTLQHLQDHAALSCGSLCRLVLEAGKMTVDTNPTAHQAAKLVGMAHGLTNALRTSIPVISTTGKLIVPEDLCRNYGVTSPRYLLSALGQGDIEAHKALARAVQDICETAREHLQQARLLRDDILQEPQGRDAVSVLLPALASETFLQRLQDAKYNLTDRNLRNVGTMEHVQCATKIIIAYYQQRY